MCGCDDPAEWCVANHSHDMPHPSDGCPEDHDHDRLAPCSITNVATICPSDYRHGDVV
mgnify:CR=1 FL=1